MHTRLGKLALCMALLAAAIGGAGGYLLQQQDAGPSSTGMPPGSPAAQAAEGRAFVAGPGRLPVLQLAAPVTDPMPVSRFAVDGNGSLIIDEKTETLLDQYLATLPPEPDAMQRQKLAQEMTNGLSDGAAARVNELMHAYIAYRGAATALAQEEDPTGLDEMKAAAEKRIALRRKYFDRDIADALFGTREAQQVYSIEVARIASDSVLDAEGKRQAIRSLHAGLPPRVAAAELNRAEDFSAELEMRVAALRLHGAPDEEIRHLRHHYFGMAEREPEK